MKPIFLGVGIFVFASFLSAKDSPFVKEVSGFVNDLTGVLVKIKDTESERASMPILKKLDVRYVELKKKLSEEKLTAEDEKKIQGGSEANELNRELVRVFGISENKLELKQLKIFHWLLEGQGEVAKTQVQTLDRAVEIYLVRFGKYPQYLNALTETKPPILKSKEALIDPWGSMYLYDPEGFKNNAKKPDIWTISPEQVIFGNWKKSKKFR